MVPRDNMTELVVHYGKKRNNKTRSKKNPKTTKIKQTNEKIQTKSEVLISIVTFYLNRCKTTELVLFL